MAEVAAFLEAGRTCCLRQVGVTAV